MRHPLRLLLTLALVAAALYGAAKGYMYYRVKQTLDEVAVQASGHGTLAYGAIDTDLRGRVTVHDLRFRPNAAPDELSVRRLHIRGPSALYFLDPRNDWTDEAAAPAPPPPRLQLHLEELAMPQSAAPGSPTAADVCRTGRNDPALLAALGLDRPLLDSEFGWDLDAAARSMDASFGFELRGVQSLRAEIRLDKVPLDGLGDGGSLPELRGFDLVLRVEPAFGNKFALECGRRRGVGPDEFKALLLAEHLAEIEAAGLQLGTGLRFALEQFYAKWGEVQLSARPKAPVGIMSLAFLPPNRLAETLNLNLRVNEARITDLGFVWEPSEGGTASLAALMGAEPPATAQAAVRRRQRLETYWVEVAPGALSGHLRRDVRLQVSGQPPREGMLESIREGVAAVQQRVHGGHFTAYVPLAEIRRAEVQMRRVIERELPTQQGETEQAEADDAEAAGQ